MTVRQAVLLVGGRATRMWPITAEIPKGLLPLVGLPFIEYQIDRLAEIGVDEVFLTVGTHLLDEWEAFVSQPVSGVVLRLIVEDQPLDTAGGVRSALDGLDERFFVLNGDVILDADLRPLLADTGTEATLALVEVDDTSPYGVVVVGEDGRVERFLEKMPTADAPARTVNAGVYVMSRAALEAYPLGPLSFERTVFPDLAERGALAAVTLDARWLDIGTPTLYLDAHGETLGGAGAWSWIDPSATVSPEAVVEDAVVLGGARVGPGAVVRRGVIGWDAVVGEGATVTGDSMIGPRAVVGARCELTGGARLAPDAVLGEAAIRFQPPE
ncbi:MAG TPA: NDP-sugar synthase [Acidimicrobiia bacterium]|nr:NDP-sugar synthase [Acidimicrobiia bacterium]